MQRVAFSIIAALSISVSLALTLHLCWTVRGAGLISAILAIAIGLTLELSKYTLAPVGMRLLFAPGVRRRVAGGTLIATSAVLVVGSLGASIAYLVATSDAQRHEMARNSEAYRATSVRLQNLEAELAVLAETAKQDTAHNYRKRALETAETLRTLRREHVELQQSLSTTLQVATGTTPTQRLAETLGVPSPWFRLLLFGVLAALVEALSMIAILMLAASPLPSATVAVAKSLQPVVEVAPEVEAPLPEVAPPAEPPLPEVAPEVAPLGEPSLPEVAPVKLAAVPPPSEPMELEEPTDPDPLETARRAIIRGELAPILRDVQRELNMSQRPAQRILKTLADEGLLRRDTRGRYCVALNGHNAAVHHAIN